MPALFFWETYGNLWRKRAKFLDRSVARCYILFREFDKMGWRNMAMAKRLAAVFGCILAAVVVLFVGIVLIFGRGAVKGASLNVNGMYIYNKNVDVRAEKYNRATLGFPVSFFAKAVNIITGEKYFCADLPLTKVLRGLEMQIKWLDDYKAEVTYNKNKYILDLNELTFLQEGKDENLLIPVEGKRRVCKALERELVLDDGTIVQMLKRMEAEVSIEVDFEKAAVDVATCREGTVFAIEREGRDELGNDLYNLKIGSIKIEGLNLLDSVDGTSNKRPMTVQIYGTLKKDTDYIPVIAVKRGGQLLLFDWDMCNSFIPQILLGDVDGDGEDEIVYGNPTFNDGLSLHVFKVFEDKLLEIYRFPDYTNIAIRNYSTWYIASKTLEKNSINLGFTGRLEDGFKLVIENPDIGFEQVVDLGQEKFDYIDKSLYFDKDGRAKAPLLNRVGPDYKDLQCSLFFWPVRVYDFDGDDAVEIGVWQTIGFDKESQYVGYVFSILKFDKQSKEFKLAEADFADIEDILRTSIGES